MGDFPDNSKHTHTVGIRFEHFFRLILYSTDAQKTTDMKNVKKELQKRKNVTGIGKKTFANVE